MNRLFQFELAFAIPQQTFNAVSLSNSVFEAGFEDAVVGTGIVGSHLHEVRPDLVSLADVAEKLSVKRQALQQRTMPLPVASGLYRVDEVYKYLEEAMKPAMGKRAPRFDLESARGWFSAGEAARKLNAKMVLGQLD